MGLWIFMLITAVLCPVLMVAGGLMFLRAAPKKINYIFGYRTTMSMKNRDTWEFAHKYFGRLWLLLGLPLVILSVIPMLLVIGKSDELISIVGLSVCFVDMAVMIAAIFPTEKALRITFDKNGNRLQ